MKKKSESTWQEIRRKIRTRFVSGMLVLAPIGVTLLVMRWVLTWMAGFLQPMLEKLAIHLASVFHWGYIPPGTLRLPVMIVSIGGFLAAIYATGTLAQAMIGRRLIRSAEMLLMKVPLASTIYSSAKQVMEAVAIPDRTAFRKVVLIEFPRPGIWSIGFLTGSLLKAGNQEMLKIFVPTTPNPTTGFFVIAPSPEVVMTNLTVEDAFKTIISGGIVSPPELEDKLSTVQTSRNKVSGNPD